MNIKQSPSIEAIKSRKNNIERQYNPENTCMNSIIFECKRQIIHGFKTIFKTHFTMYSKQQNPEHDK